MRVLLPLVAAAIALAWGLAPTPPAAANALPSERYVGELESVFRYEGAMPTGVTVSQGGRIFTNFPRWGDGVEATVAEIRDGELVPYPNAAINQPDFDDLASSFVSVQSVVVGPANRLWVLDTGSIEFGPTEYGGPKLVGIDLERDAIARKIVLPREVALAMTYLNDVRFDLRRGEAGMAFITDSSLSGPNGIIVVDLASGESWRQLHDHPSTRAEPDFLPLVEGKPLLSRPPQGETRPFAVGSDGIALGADGQRLYYCPLSSRRLYSVSADVLADPDRPAAPTVIDHGEKGASDGLAADARNRIYTTDYEHNAIHRRHPDGQLETLVHDPRLLWPDTLSLPGDGYLYVTANQLQRSPNFHRGEDRRERPYSLFRLPVEADPVRLR
ncbi:MAG: gluconolaconase [Cyanobacteria bacterium QS_8_64_29]|nr:MAG: gluconolaconase [Cyanobacteria bacterium QS_8_64_29]